MRLIGVMLAVAVVSCANAPAAFPLDRVSETPLTGGSVRFDYLSLDAQRHLLFIAHMGAGELIEVDTTTHSVVRTITGLPDVHGVLVVPDKHRVYATATGRNTLVALDENTGGEVFRTLTDQYPDGIAYDPVRNTVWTTNEAAGSETVVDADSGAVRSTIPLGGEVGNVAYDAIHDRMIVAVQGRNDLAVIDPGTSRVVDRFGAVGCDRPHGLALDPVTGQVYVGCEANATVVSIDLGTRSVTDRRTVGDTPDVLVFDAELRRLYVAAESGQLNVFEPRNGGLTPLGEDHVAAGAHSVALDPTTHHVFIPTPSGSGTGPALWEFEPVH